MCRLGKDGMRIGLPGNSTPVPSILKETVPMPAIHQPQESGCQRLTRRQFVQAGNLGLLGLSLPQLLHADGLARRERNEPRAKACLFINQYGGASQIDTWDPKPDAPMEIRGPYQPIATSTPGIRVCELLPR